MGLFSRNPKPGSEIRITFKGKTGESYGLSIGDAAIFAGSRDCTPIPWENLRWMDAKVQQVPDDTIPRDQMRPMLMSLGVPPAEVMVLGVGATTRELNQCWRVIQEQDRETIDRLVGRVRARREKEHRDAA
jgi:hypothetical protein